MRFFGFFNVPVAFRMITQNPERFQEWVNARASGPVRVRQVRGFPYTANLEVTVVSKATVHAMPERSERPETLRDFDRVATMAVGDGTGTIELVATGEYVDEVAGLEVGQKLRFNKISHGDLQLPFLRNEKKTHCLIYGYRTEMQKAGAEGESS